MSSAVVSRPPETLDMLAERLWLCDCSHEDIHGILLRNLNELKLIIERINRFNQQRPVRRTLDECFSNWFCGYFDADGCFKFEKRRRRLLVQIECRLDDVALLLRVFRYLGGVIYYKAQGKKNSFPVAQWRINSEKDLLSIIVPFFERHKLKSKKELEYRLWTDLLKERREAYKNRNVCPDALCRYERRFDEIKEYVDRVREPWRMYGLTAQDDDPLPLQI